MHKQKLAAMLAAHHAAFMAKARAASYEKRDDGTADAAQISKIGEAIEKIGQTFDEYKTVNDQRLERIEKGAGTEDLDAKLAKMDEALTSFSEVKSKLEKVETRIARPGFGAGADGKIVIPEEAEYRAAMFDWMRKGVNGRDDPRMVQRMMEAGAKLEARDRADGREVRSTYVSAGTNTAGGYALPKEIESTIMRLLLDVSPIRGLATVRTIGTTDYHEVVDKNGQGFGWAGETDTRSQTNTADFADITVTMGTLYAYPWATEESMDDLFFNVEQWLIQSSAEGMAQGEGAAFVSGNGTKKPTGFLTGTPVATADSSRAFGVLQYIASGQAAAMPTNLDPLYDMIYSLRARYRNNASWVTSKLTLAALRKYKDTTNQYLWQPSIVAGQPDMFMGYGITEAEDMPAIAANAFPLAFGDFREGYLITDRVGMRITRDEITTPGYVKFYVRKRVGGNIRNSQAIKLLKISTS